MTEGKPQQHDPKNIPRKMGPFIVFVLKEILRQKKWLLLPIWVLLAAIGLFIILGGGSAILPAIYIVL